MANQETSSSTVTHFRNKYSKPGSAALLIIIGAILFVIPEPLTSGLGVIMVLAGIALWFADRLWG